MLDAFDFRLRCSVNVDASNLLRSHYAGRTPRIASVRGGVALYSAGIKVHWAATFDER